MNIQFISKEQDFQNEQTRYWFTLTGVDHGTGAEFDEEEFAICESGPDNTVLDADGVPMTDSDYCTIAVRRHCIVTDEMRAE